MRLEDARRRIVIYSLSPASAAADGKAAEAGKAVEQAKGPGELLEEALKSLECLPEPTGKAGKAWKQERVRIIALVRQAMELIDGRVAEETPQGTRQRGAA